MSYDKKRESDAKPRESRENWLLIKGDDSFARESGEPDILEERPESVLTGREIDAEGPEVPAAESPRTKRRTAPGSKTKAKTLPDPEPEQAQQQSRGMSR